MGRIAVLKVTGLALGGAALLVLGAVFFAAPAAAYPDPEDPNDQPGSGYCWNPAYMLVWEQYEATPDQTVTVYGARKPWPNSHENVVISTYTTKGSVDTVTLNTNGIQYNIDMAHVVPYHRCGSPGNWQIPTSTGVYKTWVQHGDTRIQIDAGVPPPWETIQPVQLPDKD